jgi:Predicted dehydrogenases and related proteins
MKVGVLGLGDVSRQYLDTIRRLRVLTLVAVADRTPAKAEAIAQAEGVSAVSIDRLLGGGVADLVINLTPPTAHAELTARALAAGVSVYSEKPLAVTREDADELIALAARTGARLACAPDTVLGTGVQTARAAVDAGRIGRPVAATATMLVPGHEHWHPNPAFFYREGGGPLLDRGPYELTTLLHLLGPVVEVVGMSARPRRTRVALAGPRAGAAFPVEVDTHVTGSLRHRDGAVSTIVMSFDVVATRASHIEVHGERASLIVPSPNAFSGHVLRRALGEDGWELLPVGAGYRDASRGYGAADLATTAPGAERASADIARHALDVALSLLESARDGGMVPTRTSFRAPDPLPLSDAPGGLAETHTL